MYKPTNSTFRPGTLTVFCGCMFAGKTDALIRQIQISIAKKAKILVLKPKIDFRSGCNQIKSLTGLVWPAESVGSALEMSEKLANTKNYSVLFLDEVQFFPATIVPLIEKVLNSGIDVFISGLDRGFSDHNLPVMNQLLALADVVQKFFARCGLCGARANKTQRIGIDRKPIAPADSIRRDKDLVGGTDTYEPRCRNCYLYFSWEKPNRSKI